MAAKISSISDLFNRFHACELYVKQGKIAACLISFKEIVERMPAISMKDKDKKELHEGIERFLKNLSAHKKFKEIFGAFSFADTDLDKNLEFIKSMITAQEDDIIERIKKEEEAGEEASEAQRLELLSDEEKKKKAIKLIDEGNLPQAAEIIKDSEEIREGIILHYNTIGMQNRETKNFDDAVNNYSKAVSVSPEDENLHYNIARVYFEDGKRDKAQEFLEKALKLNPEFKEGKVFYEYLLKADQTNASNGSSNGGKKSGGIFRKLFPVKK